MLAGLPLVGISFIGQSFQTYLEFPPSTQYVKHAPFSWFVFFLFLIAIIIVVILSGTIIVCSIISSPKTRSIKNFPWWGWIGGIFGLAFWLIAWNRFPWAELIQEHTFFPLWISYIIVINALTYRKSGHCMITHHTRYFLLLFPASMVFWWFFEYLNRFVQNWHYLEVQRSPLQYFLLCNIAFSTVLPAVLGTRDWLLTHNWIREGVKFNLSYSPAKPVRLGIMAFLVAAFGLLFIGIFPDYLFPLLWVSPLVILLSLKTILGEKSLLWLKDHGNQQLVFTSAIAALICGFFWEMWNYYSLVKWQYSIPFVDRFLLFEMPVLGYSGYLPFGLECAVIGQLIEELVEKKPQA